MSEEINDVLKIFKMTMEVLSIINKKRRKLGRNLNKN
jgi:hypothetical protein